MKILCVDDELLALEMLEEAVCEAQPDADVKAFRKQSELLAEAESGGCDIAFLDIHMRGMNGVELAKKLKELNPKMNIIFVTGFDAYTGDAMKLHASGYIMKPVTKEKIEEELADLRFPIEPKSGAILRVPVTAYSLIKEENYQKVIVDVCTPQTASPCILSAARARRSLPISCIAGAARVRSRR